MRHKNRTTIVSRSMRCQTMGVGETPLGRHWIPQGPTTAQIEVPSVVPTRYHHTRSTTLVPFQNDLSEPVMMVHISSNGVDTEHDRSRAVHPDTTRHRGSRIEGCPLDQGGWRRLPREEKSQRCPCRVGNGPSPLFRGVHTSSIWEWTIGSEPCGSCTLTTKKPFLRNCSNNDR